MCTYIREYLWTRLVCCLISEYKKQEVGDTVNCEAVDRFQKRLFFLVFKTHIFNVCGDLQFLYSKNMIQNLMHQHLRLYTYRIKLGHEGEYSGLPEALKCADFILFYFMPS